MNFKTLSIAVLSICGLIAAEQVERDLKDTAVCSRELEGIVYQPHSAALAYFNRISEEIKVAGPILWTSQNVSFIQTFETKYQVDVQVYDAFGYLIYPEVGSKPTNFMSTTAIANMNGSGYVRDTDKDDLARYEFIVYDCVGRLKYVMLNMPLEDAPSFKK